MVLDTAVYVAAGAGLACPTVGAAACCSRSCIKATYRVISAFPNDLNGLYIRGPDVGGKDGSALETHYNRNGKGGQIYFDNGWKLAMKKGQWTYRTSEGARSSAPPDGTFHPNNDIATSPESSVKVTACVPFHMGEGHVKLGTTGMVSRYNDDGDALIKFEGFHEEHWVKTQHFSKLIFKSCYILKFETNRPSCIGNFFRDLCSCFCGAVHVPGNYRRAMVAREHIDIGAPLLKLNGVATASKDGRPIRGNIALTQDAIVVGGQQKDQLPMTYKDVWPIGGYELEQNGTTVTLTAPVITLQFQELGEAYEWLGALRLAGMSPTGLRLQELLTAASKLSVVVTDAGKCNGVYHPVGYLNSYVKYQRGAVENPAIIYFKDSWKINAEDDSDASVYSNVSKDMLPPLGEWQSSAAGIKACTLKMAGPQATQPNEEEEEEESDELFAARRTLLELQESLAAKRREKTETQKSMRPDASRTWAPQLYQTAIPAAETPDQVSHRPASAAAVPGFDADMNVVERLFHEIPALRDVWMKKEPILDTVHLWKGVTCRDQGHFGRIFGLSLKQAHADIPKHLVKLPECIGSFTALVNLDVSGCELLESFPASIGHLRTLTTLKANNCTKLSHLPEHIDGLVELKSLSLSGCCSLEKLPERIGKLKHLHTLDLTRCSKLRYIPNTVGELQVLEKLKLMRCSSLLQLPEKIGDLKSLTSLDLWECAAIKTLPARVAELMNLKKVDLRGCQSLHKDDAILGKLRERGCEIAGEGPKRQGTE